MQMVVSGMWPSIVATSLGIFFFIGSCTAESAPYTSFAKDATLAPPGAYYDYIVIGGGTAGCALAATLSEGANILLLERGDLPYGNPNIENVGGFAATLADISPTSASQFFVSTDGVFNHRPRVLGGGTALNAGFYSRAETNYVQEVGWDQKLVNESYEWVEKRLVFQPPMLAWQSAVRDGLLEAGVLPNHGFTYDHLVGTKIGGTIFDQHGHRHTAADLLEYADPTKITLHFHATVQQILFKTTPGQRPKAYGVFYRDSKGGRHVAYLNSGSMNEVILSSGAIGSPQLLMLSGIGPAQHLKAYGIEIVMNHPNVGQGMSDNPLNTVIMPSTRPIELSLVQMAGITEVGSYVETISGFFNMAWVHKLAEKYALLAKQTIHPFEVPVNQSMPEARPVYNPYTSPNLQAGIIAGKIAKPFSTGYLELQSIDPNDNPRVTFNYYKDPRDLQSCVQGMDVIRRVVESRSLSSFRYPFTSMKSLMNAMLALPINLRKRHVSATYSTEQFCNDTIVTIWHYHGGCQVNRVVDQDYKVLGVDALRVVDGSTFYDSPGTNPQATVMMLGRYMGKRILSERPGS